MPHTKGPWTPEEHKVGGESAFIYIKSKHSQYNDVATVYCTNNEARQADVALICAAPELLEALEEVLKMEHLSVHDNLSINNLIAKAKGKGKNGIIK